MRGEFQHIAFEDAAQAEECLGVVIGEASGDLAAHLAGALETAAEPCKALVRMERFFACCMSPDTQREMMAAMPRYARLLVTILDQSHYLSDILCRNPEYMSWLWEEVDLGRACSREEMIDELLHQIQAFDTFEARCKSMRRYKRREILRIAVRDVFAHASVSSVTEDLSNLADAELVAALESARLDLRRRFGKPMGEDGEDAQFVILGMGKLGGRELNFSSDIDLIFLYSDEGETCGGESGKLSNVEYYQKLGERVIKALNDQTDEGQVFRVDMRLRPYGRVGPLAMSVDSAVRYYERAGQAWERQALIKTRPVAGDVKLGRKFIERTRPFVFPRYFDDETLEDIRETKRQMEALVEGRGQTDSEVKLGRGGIRDIEFTVQMLQLLNGGRVPSLRGANTLQMIEQLGKRIVLRPLEANTLVSNYTFMRQLEHRLQIEGSQQRHALPTDPLQLDILARRLGYGDGDSLMADYRDRTSATREILDRFLAAEGSGKLWVSDLLNPRSDGARGLARLERMGFADPEKARQELLVLSHGTRERPNTLHARQSFAAIAPRLLGALSECPDPDSTLLRLGRLLTNLRAPASIYDIVRNTPGVSEYLTRLVANSEFLSEILIRDPGLFDEIGAPGALDVVPTREELEEQLSSLLAAYDPEAAPYRFLSGELLRIGMRDLFADVGVTELGVELSLVAEACLRYALERARAEVTERYGPADVGFAVLGLGKLGGREMGYGSDLDLVFVYEDGKSIESGIGGAEYFAAVASRMLRNLKEPTRHGILYDVDARLRPDGKKGTLVVSASRLRDYYAGEAQAWERLALMKARAVAGDVDFGRAMEDLARDVVFGAGLTPDDVANIDTVREKIVANASPLDLKKHEGGIAEIEFAVRMLQLRHAGDEPALRRGDVAGALDALARIGALAKDDALALADAYAFLRRVENRIRMMHGRSGSILPEEPNARADLGKRLGMTDDLAALVMEKRHRVHEIYLGVLDVVRK